MLTSTSSITLITLMFVCIISTLLLVYLLNRKKKKQLDKVFIVIVALLLFWIILSILQIVGYSIFNINPIYFDYFVYISTCNMPVVLLLLALAFSKTTVNIKKYIYLFIIPTLSLFLLWTNNLHHLFLIEYSINMSEGIVGKYFYIHHYYTLLLYGISFFILVRYSIKNSGFFSKQALLILLGALIPIITNLLGFMGILSMSIYVTPITFAFAIFFIAFAIFKFDFLIVTPIALQRIVDRISDSYVVLNEDMVITDFNQTLLNTFSLTSFDVRNVNIIDLLAKHSNLNIDVEVLIKAINKTKLDDSTITLENHFETIDKYFHVEINSIKQKSSYLGTLILLKDITQHTHDMQTIKENQEILVEKERLASLGQMIGGIAHNLKTPIMSIAGAAEGLSDLTNEYRSSVGDPEVTVEDHHAIANDMDEWIGKIRTHLSYMSDIITAVKGQAVAFSDNMINGFTVDELIKHVDILMKHELKNALINLNTTVSLDKKTKVDGNINSLVQVINNIISNAIQAYDGKPNENINLTLSKKR